MLAFEFLSKYFSRNYFRLLAPEFFKEKLELVKRKAFFLGYKRFN